MLISKSKKLWKQKFLIRLKGGKNLFGVQYFHLWFYWYHNKVTFYLFHVGNLSNLFKLVNFLPRVTKNK